VTYTYSFRSDLSQVPGYQRESTASLLARAKAAADLAADPQKQQAQRLATQNERDYYNNLQKMKASNVGTNAALNYGNQQAKKTAAARAINSGAIGSSGLQDYLNNEADIATQAQRLNIAATQSANANAANTDYQGRVNDMNTLLSDIETNRGKTASSLYQDYEAAQDAAQQSWNQNALNVALGIGSGELNAADLAQRKANEAAQVASQLYVAELPYNALTQYQKGQLDLDTTIAMGKTTGSKSNSGGSSRSSSGTNYTGNNGVYSLRDVASQNGINVAYDSNSGNVTIGNRTYSPSTLTAMGGYISNGRWQLPSSIINGILNAS